MMMLLLQLVSVASAWMIVSPPAARRVLSRSATTSVQKRMESRSFPEPETPSFQSLFDFRKPESIDWWERIDDVVMGGMSSSGLRQEKEKAVWSGIIRTDGGGFVGTRTKRLEAPMDLSLWSGLFIDAKVSDQSPRSWKMTLRCDMDSGEVVYNAEFAPKGRKTLVPFNTFRLVRGPRIIEGAPPLSRDLKKCVYGIGLTCSKFDKNGTVLKNFQEGFFRVDIKEIGVFGSFWPKLRHPPDVQVPRPCLSNPSQPNSANSQNFVVKSLVSPLSSLVFSEKARRRQRARTLLQKKKNKSPIEARLWGQQVIKRGIKNQTLLAATVDGVKDLSRDIAAAIFAFPLRLLFRIIFKTLRFSRYIKTKLSPPKKQDSED